LRKPYRSAENVVFLYHVLAQCDVDHMRTALIAQKVSATTNKTKRNIESLRCTSQMPKKVG